jgi:hypothetical protein
MIQSQLTLLQSFTSRSRAFNSPSQPDRPNVTAVTEPLPHSRDYLKERQEAAMPVAQIIRFDERQAIGRRRRAAPLSQMGVVLEFPRAAMPAVQIFADDDRIAGRGRDPG